MNKCITTIKTNDCTGCGVCENICPAEAIFMKTDHEGFWHPYVDEQECIRCGRCYEVCPLLIESADMVKDVADGRGCDVYAAWTLDKEVRYHSTSGGIFSELAAAALQDNGYVCGAVYDEQQNIKHSKIHRKKDIEKLRQSKYAQSDMGTIYNDVGELLKKGKAVLFCGSPCHCAGMFSFCQALNIDRTNLYLVDFICRGANSPKVYHKFLAELKDIHKSEIRKVWFKNKTYGWNRFSTKIEFDDGTAYLKDRFHDTYIRGYIEENLFIRPSCSNCSFKGFNRIADITLADFWGVQLDGRMEESDGGTSLVMVHTDKGRNLWQKILPRIYCVEKTLDEALPGNVCFAGSVMPGTHRWQFMDDLDRMSVIDNIERFLK